IDDNDLFGMFEKLPGHTLGWFLAGDGGNSVLEFGNVLQVYAGNNGDPGRQQLFDVVVSPQVWRAGWNVIGETIDQDDLRPSFYDSCDVDDILIADLERRNDLKFR